MTNKEIAIIMAAGLGQRMRPLTLKTPKPLIEVLGTPMIETIIMGLEYRGVSQIYIVVGYLKDQFRYLEEKYTNITLIENKEYALKNNISSIYAVDSIFGSADCFICEADLYILDTSIFDGEFNNSCYYGKKVNGHSDDWVFHTVDGRITKIREGGDNLYNMVGISYFKKADAKVIARAIKDAYKNPGYEKLFWDEIVDQQLQNIYLTLHPIKPKQIIEIDTLTELKAIDPSYGILI